MNLDDKFGKFFDTIIINNKRKKLFNILTILYDKNLLDQELILCIIKSLILVLSYNPEKIDILTNIINSYQDCGIELQKNLSNLFKKIDLSQQFSLSENVVDKIIFNTIDFFEIIEKNNLKLLFQVWYDIILNTYNIKKKDKNFKISMYLFFIKKSKKIINDNNKNNFYLKIINLCSSTRTIINEFISRK